MNEKFHMSPTKFIKIQVKLFSTMPITCLIDNLNRFEYTQINSFLTAINTET